MVGALCNNDILRKREQTQKIPTLNPEMNTENTTFYIWHNYSHLVLRSRLAWQDMLATNWENQSKTVGVTSARPASNSCDVILSNVLFSP